MVSFDAWLSRAGSIASIVSLAIGIGTAFSLKMLSTQPDWVVAVAVLGSAATAYFITRATSLYERGAVGVGTGAPKDTPADGVRRYVDQGGLDRLPAILERGEYLQRVLGRAREKGVAALWQSYKRTRRFEIADWNENLVRSLPTDVRAAERWLASPPPQAGSDAEAYLAERLTLLRRILAR